MEIYVGENYRIKTDSMNYILQEKKVSDPNHRFSKGVAKVSWNDIGYYGKFEQLADALIEREIRGLDSTSLKDLKIDIRVLKQLLVEVISRKN